MRRRKRGVLVTEPLKFVPARGAEEEEDEDRVEEEDLDRVGRFGFCFDTGYCRCGGENPQMSELA